MNKVITAQYNFVNGLVLLVFGSDVSKFKSLKIDIKLCSLKSIFIRIHLISQIMAAVESKYI